MEDCIFCKIVRGQEKSFKIYEDENFLAFLDIDPLVDGHTLVIPKAHYRWVWDLSSDQRKPDNIGEYIKVCQKIAKHFQIISGNDFVVEMIFGNEVAHAHIHLLPVINKFQSKKIENATFSLRKSRLKNEEAIRLRGKLKL